jgi:hypothetical protein
MVGQVISSTKGCFLFIVFITSALFTFAIIDNYGKTPAERRAEASPGVETKGFVTDD